MLLFTTPRVRRRKRWRVMAHENQPPNPALKGAASRAGFNSPFGLIVADPWRTANLRRGKNRRPRERAALRRCRVPAEPVEEERVEAIRELVGGAPGPEPGVRPVRGREEEEGGRGVVEIGSQLRQLSPLAERDPDVQL